MKIEFNEKEKKYIKIALEEYNDCIKEITENTHTIKRWQIIWKNIETKFENGINEYSSEEIMYIEMATDVLDSTYKTNKFQTAILSGISANELEKSNKTINEKLEKK